MNCEFVRRRHGVGLALIVAVLWLGLSAPADAFLVNIGYAFLGRLETAKAVHHDITITLDDTGDRADFVDDLTVRMKKQSNELFVQLGLDYTIDKVTTLDGELLPHKAHINLGALPFTIYRIELPDRVKANAETSVRVHYHIAWETATYSFPYLWERLFFVVIPMLWYPQMPTEGFFEATVHINDDTGMTMIGEGAPVPGTDGKSWRTVAPVPGLGVAVGDFVSHYEHIYGKDVYAWHHRTESAGYSRDMARKTAQAVALFDDWFGPLPGLQRLDIVALPYGLGGSVSQYSLIMYDEWNVEIPLDDPVMRAYMAAHEAAHKWLGFSAGLQILGTPWITEGLTDYLAFLAMEQLHGIDAMRHVIEQRAYEPLAAYNGRLPAISSLELNDENVPVAYQKGALVFRALHRRLGDEAFFDFVGTFLSTYEQGHATAADFTKLMEAEGGPAVRGFVRDWVSGRNELDYELGDVAVESSGGAAERETARFIVRSAARGGLEEPGAVDVALHVAGGEVITVSVPLGKIQVVDVSAPVEKIVVDPDYWLPDWNRDNNVWVRE